MTAAAAPPHAFALRLQLLTAWQALERGIDRFTGPALNPLHHLGSLGFLCFWSLAASGIYLYAVIDTSAAGAYASIERLADWPWLYGGWLRSVHRYAADALVVLLGLHGLREWLHERFAGPHGFSWLTGVPLVVFAFVCGIGGFWLNWDALGQYSAEATAEWLDALPWLGAPLARNFLSAGAVGDRLFSLFVFVHLGVALLMTFGLWFHIQRLPRARVLPPWPMALAVLGMLLGLAALAPITSGPAADVAQVPAALALDWLLLFIHPLASAVSNGGAWALVAGALGLLLLLPAWPRTAPALPVAAVDPAHCSGCRRCVDDCPYAAISMVEHPSGKPGHALAQVDAARCASCGICAGACPSSTPFRSLAQLVTGIDLPQLSIHSLRQQLRAGLQASNAARPIVVFACTQAQPVSALQAPDVLRIDLVCAGQLPPSFIEYALRDGAAGVLIQGCTTGECAFRDGPQLLHERLLGQREPHLRPSVPRQRWAQADGANVRDALDRLRDAALARGATPSPSAIEVLS